MAKKERLISNQDFTLIIPISLSNFPSSVFLANRLSFPPKYIKYIITLEYNVGAKSSAVQVILIFFCN